MSLDTIQTIFLIIPFIIFFTGIVYVSIREGKKNHGNPLPHIRTVMMIACISFPIYIFTMYALSSLSSKQLDDMKSIAISPTKATVDIDNSYPWGVNINLQNGQKYKTRVDNQDLFIDLMEQGALLGKRANSRDIYLYINNDTICIPIQHNFNLTKRTISPKK